ncbi:MAG: DUF433 domain-containing protein [Spirochaetota bacterium]
MQFCTDDEQDQLLACSPYHHPTILITRMLHIKNGTPARGQTLRALQPLIRGNCMRFDRIASNPAVMAGKPCIKGTRVTVGTILGQLGAGRSTDQVLNDFP